MSLPALRQPWALRAGSAAFLIFCCILAAFPILWIAVTSVKSPVDAFDANPLAVILGPRTRADGHGLSVIDIVLGLGALFYAVQFAFTRLPPMVAAFTRPGFIGFGWMIGALGCAIIFVIGFFVILPWILTGLNAIAGPLGTPIVGLTTEHSVSVWLENEFYRNLLNSLAVSAGVISISLFVGTLACYALARSGSQLAF